MRWHAMALTAALTAVLLWLVDGTAAAPAATAAEEQTSAFAASPGAVERLSPAVAAQGGDEEANPEGNDPVPVQVWTVLAAAGAAGVGLVLFVLRLAMGWVKPPPPPEESHH